MPVHAFHTHFTPHRSPCEASARSWVLSWAQTLPGATSSSETPSDSSPSISPSLTQTPPRPHMDQKEGPESEPCGEGAGPGAPGDGLHRDEGSHQVGQFARGPGALSAFPVVWPSALSGTLHCAPAGHGPLLRLLGCPSPRAVLEVEIMVEGCKLATNDLLTQGRHTAHSTKGWRFSFLHIFHCAHCWNHKSRWRTEHLTSALISMISLLQSHIPLSSHPTPSLNDIRTLPNITIPIGHSFVHTHVSCSKSHVHSRNWFRPVSGELICVFTSPGLS